MGYLCNTSLSIKLPSTLQGKAERIPTSHNMMPPFGQGTVMNSSLVLLSLATHPQRAILDSPAAPARSLGRTPASRAQPPFNQVSAYQWLIVAMWQRSD